MHRVEDIGLEETLKGLISSNTSDVVAKSDEIAASLKSFETSFKKLARTPQLLRVALQNEFNFKGVVDPRGKTLAQARKLLNEEWFESSFVVADRREIRPWLIKCLQESEKGNTVVVLLPNRSDSKWFHRILLREALEIRFIEGKMQCDVTGEKMISPSVLGVFKNRPPRRARLEGAVAIIECNTNLRKTNFNAVIHPPSPPPSPAK